MPSGKASIIFLLEGKTLNSPRQIWPSTIPITEKYRIMLYTLKPHFI